MISNLSNLFESGKDSEGGKRAIITAMKGTDGTNWELQKGLGNPDKMKFYIVKQPQGGEKRIRIKVECLFNTQKVSLINLIINSELRKQWEPAQINFSYKQNTRNWVTQRVRYIYNSPLTTVSVQKSKEKQLVLDQALWHNFPEKGFTTIHYESVTDKQWTDSENIESIHMK